MKFLKFSFIMIASTAIANPLFSEFISSPKPTSAVSATRFESLPTEEELASQNGESLKPISAESHESALNRGDAPVHSLSNQTFFLTRIFEKTLETVKTLTQTLYLKKSESSHLTLGTSVQKIESGSVLTASRAYQPASVPSTLPQQIAMAEGGNGGDRGGGDLIAIDFLAHGQAFAQDLFELHQKQQFIDISSDALKQAILGFRIGVVNQRPLDSHGVPRDAVTDQTLKAIQLYSDYWTSSSATRESKALLTIHEYLRASGYSEQDDHYSWSQQILDALISSSASSHLLNVSGNQIDAMLFIKALNNRKLNCKAIVELDGFGKNRKIEILSSDLGVKVTLEDEKGKVGTYSDLNRTVPQVTYGKMTTTFILLRQARKKYITLTLESPDAVRNDLLGTYSITSYNHQELPVTTPVKCHLDQ